MTRFRTDVGDGDLERFSAASLRDDVEDEDDDDDLDDDDDEDELLEPQPAPLESEPELLDLDLLLDVCVEQADVFILLVLIELIPVV